MNAPQALEVCMQTLATLPPEQQLDVLTKLFSNVSKLPVEDDFFRLLYQAMHNFKKCGRPNLVYLLSRCAGTVRNDGSDSLLPLKRMPTGLIEYVLQFFNAESVTQVSTRNCVHACMYVLSYSCPCQRMSIFTYKVVVVYGPHGFIMCMNCRHYSVVILTAFVLSVSICTVFALLLTGTVSNRLPTVAAVYVHFVRYEVD